MGIYRVFQLKHQGNQGNQGLLADLQDLKNTFGATRPDSELVGVFTGLFGLASDECLLVIKQQPLRAVSIDSSFTMIKAHTFTATVRPTETQSFDQSGIYVFRFWTLAGSQVEPLIALSQKAWATFEDDFDTEVKALFRQSPSAHQETALLITWYKNFAAWEASRQPDPAAASHFRERQRLVDQAFPIATRLLD